LIHIREQERKKQLKEIERLETQLIEKQKELRRRQEVLSNLISEMEGGTGECNKDFLLCIICEDAPREICFDPCGHAATCHEHSDQSVCPICRSPILAKKPFYLC